MNNLWIIGNGFDINYGLKTGYGSFLEKSYLADEEIADERKKLIEYAGDPLDNIEKWSDLEMLLGEVSVEYESSEIEVFHSTFEHMEDLMLDYLESEEEKITDLSISDKCQTEFASSIAGFHERMRVADKNRFYRHLPCNDNCWHSFISLNYTSLLDKLVERSVVNGQSFSMHKGKDGKNHSDLIMKLLHPHGMISENREIAFGVSDETQLANKAVDANFRNLWVKQLRNLNEFKNLRTEEAFQLFKDADTFCLFGVSLGNTDDYLWKQIATKLEQQNICLFFYAYGYVDGVARRENQEKRHDVEDRLKHAFGWDDEKYFDMQDRIFIEPSERLFKTGLQLDSADKR